MAGRPGVKQASSVIHVQRKKHLIHVTQQTLLKQATRFHQTRLARSSGPIHVSNRIPATGLLKLTKPDPV
jgi:hypothetical protein